MKYILVMNPVAGPGISEKKIKEQLNNLEKEIEYELYLTKGVKDATRFVKETIDNNQGKELCFVACGGDGTINEVFDGCAHQENIYASVIPSGSGNDFVKCYGTEHFNVHNIIKGKAQKIDLIKVEDRYCVNAINLGIDTAVAKNVNINRDKRGHGSSLDYPLGVLKAIFTSMKTKVKVVADGELLNPDGYIISTSIANGQYIGGSYHCAPRAKLDDGLIEVCLIRPVNIIQFAKFITKYQKGTHLEDKDILKHIEYRQVKELEISAEEGFEYTLDGEIIPSANFKCTMEHLALNFIVPDKSGN